MFNEFFQPGGVVPPNDPIMDTFYAALGKLFQGQFNAPPILDEKTAIIKKHILDLSGSN